MFGPISAIPLKNIVLLPAIPAALLLYVIAVTLVAESPVAVDRR